MGALGAGGLLSGALTVCDDASLLPELEHNPPASGPRTFDFSGRTNVDSWGEDWGSNGVAHRRIQDGRAVLEAGTDFFPNDPRPVVFLRAQLTGADGLVCAATAEDSEPVLSLIYDADGLTPGVQMYWRPRLRRADKESLGPVRRFRVLPPSGDAGSFTLELFTIAGKEAYTEKAYPWDMVVYLRNLDLENVIALTNESETKQNPRGNVNRERSPYRVLWFVKRILIRTAITEHRAGHRTRDLRKTSFQGRPGRQALPTVASLSPRVRQLRTAGRPGKGNLWRRSPSLHATCSRRLSEVWRGLLRPRPFP